MSAVIWCILACVGVVAFILNDSIKGLRNSLAEAVNNQQHVFPKVQQLESEITALKRGIKGMQSEIDRMKSTVDTIRNADDQS